MGYITATKVSTTLTRIETSGQYEESPVPQKYFKGMCLFFFPYLFTACPQRCLPWRNVFTTYTEHWKETWGVFNYDFTTVLTNCNFLRLWTSSNYLLNCFFLLLFLSCYRLELRWYCLGNNLHGYGCAITAYPFQGKCKYMYIDFDQNLISCML